MGIYRFLIDVNLPKHFAFFHSEDFEFVIDINGKWPDKDIWQYAKQHNLIIVTKDTDFYHRCLLDQNSPKVIYLKLGNLLLRDLHYFFQTNWHKITRYLPEAKMVIATSNGIEVVSL